MIVVYQCVFVQVDGVLGLLAVKQLTSML